MLNRLKDISEDVRPEGERECDLNSVVTPEKAIEQQHQQPLYGSFCKPCPGIRPMELSQSVDSTEFLNKC